MVVLGTFCGESGVFGQASSPVTFTKEIAPIVFAHCVACHREGEAGPFPLVTYEDVKTHAQQIADVTGKRIMPPWLPEPGYGEFVDERRLSGEQIQLIARWVQAGAPEGELRDLPPVPRFTSGWQLGEPDLVVTMPEAYTLPAAGLDVYRNFVIPLPVNETKWVRAMELRPGNARPVHHAFMLIDPSRAGRHFEREDNEPGFEGMDPRSASGPAGQFISWQAGKRFHPGDEEIAWRLNPGTDLVLQLHMQPTGKPETIQASVGLFFADGPGSKMPLKMVLQSKEIDIPAGASNYAIEETYRLPVDVNVLAILPHTHYLGKRLEAFARRPDGTVQWLLLIKEWDFNWQGDYQYKEPVMVPAGSVLTMRYTYDNSAENIRNPNQPPKRVTYGPNSTDEMGELWLQVLPVHSGDRDFLQQDYARHMLTKSMERNRTILQRDPQNVKARIDLGHVLMAFGRMGEAQAHLSRAVELAPDSADARYFFGHAHLRQQSFATAQRELQRALELEPDRFDALHDLGLMYLQVRSPAQAEPHLARAVEINPYDAVAQSNYALSLLLQQKIAEAVPHLEQALDLDPSKETVRQRLEMARQALAAEGADSPSEPAPGRKN